MSSRIIRVRGTAEASAVPDTVVISFDIESYNYDYGRCLEQLSSQTEILRNDLATAGLEKDSLKTFHFQADTHYEHYDRRRVFKGYRASHDVRVEFPFEQDLLNSILQALSKTASSATFNLSFTVKDIEPLRRKAIADAVKNCEEKANILAEAARVSLGELIEIDYSWSEVRFQPRMELCVSEDHAGPGSFDISPEDIDVSESVTAIWAIK